MSFPARRLQAKAGAIVGQVLENTSAGIERNLFWSISVPFEPIDYEGEEVRPLLQCEWLVWPLAHWRDLDGKTLAEVKDAGRVEASFFALDHADLELEMLELAARKRGGFEVQLCGRVDFVAGDGSVKPFPIEVEAPLALEGIRIVPGSLRRGPKTAQAAAELLGQFLDAKGFLEPEWDGACFLFRPDEGVAKA